METVELPDRAWTAITAMAAAWTPIGAGPDEYLQALGRAVVMYQAARQRLEGGHDVRWGDTVVVTLVPGRDFGVALLHEG